MKIKIYQIDLERDSDRVCFWGFDMLQKLQGSEVINSSIYDTVFCGTVDNAATLEDVYRVFNIDHPVGYCGRSLSVSDVVEVIESDGSIEPGFYFCDSIGFRKVNFNN